ncbi:MAG: hypothetical protein FRX48_08053 [Lasallia pustulata]|uniref:Uncharacterized protein n=1 Tax=Lasallia pustulata TaxID=136370 RepID=A0A5M8PG53_9LECA|nr:MAG: hypothetical protein FRX48_08053 [Lasallia pustulata]
MAKKRKSPSTSIPHSKRPRHDLHSPNDDADADPSPNGLQPRLDPTYGQRGAFPGLDGDGAEAGLFYGPAQDGLEYLRMVRSEARSVPNLLVAPKLDAAAATGADTGLFEAYYHDGAYTAAPLASAAQNHDVVHHDDYDPDPQGAYYASLRARFLALRSHLHSPPLVGPPPSRPLSQASSHARWREDKTENSSTANATEPWPGSDAALAHAKHSLLSSIQRPSSPSRNSSEESSPHFAQTEGGLSDHDGEVSHAAHISEDKPEATLSAHAQSAQRDELDVYATLDMIITVVGEFYGQRDLLEERDLWDEAFEGGGLE